MRIGKKILSVILALVMLTTMVSSVFYASATDNAKNNDSQTVSVEQLVADLLGEYSDGETLVTFINDLVQSSIEGKIIYDESGRKILKGLDAELVAGADASADEAIAKYLGSGEDIIQMGDEKLMELLNTQKVLGVPIMQLRYVQNLDQLVSTILLADNSDVLKSAVETLKAIFPDVEPTYESLISCLVPILSAFNFSEIMANMENISGALQLASPVAFAYLAGIESEYLNATYLADVNTNLRAYGYTGSDVQALITLDADKAAQLKAYAEEELAGVTLSELAEEGFVWTDFIGEANVLDIANAFVKIALGDPAKLGELAQNEKVGPALVNLLCDLLNDVKKAPVSTLLKKVSRSADLAAIIDFAMGLLNNEDRDYKSFTLFSDNIFEDAGGNPAFYVKIVNGEKVYGGPKTMDQYIPIIAAGLDFLDKISTVIEENGGDLLKTLFVDRLPQLANVIKAAVSYEENDKTKLGLVMYLLENYKEYAVAENAIASDDILISFANLAITNAQQQRAKALANVAKLDGYIAAAQENANAEKLKKAKELGLADDSATAYDEAAVNAAIQAKIDQLQPEVATLQAAYNESYAYYTQVQSAYDDASAATEALGNFVNDVLSDEESLFITELATIFNEQNADAIAQLEADCAELFEAAVGEGSFARLAALISAHLADFENDSEGFITTYLYAAGEDETGFDFPTMFETYEQIMGENEELIEPAKDRAEADEIAYTLKANELDSYASGAKLAEIQAAGDTATIEIEDEDLNIFTPQTVKNLQDRKAVIENETIAGYDATISNEQKAIEDYEAEQAQNQEIMNGFSLDAIEVDRVAILNLADTLMAFLGGDEITKSLYQYFEDGQPIEMIAAPDRVQALRNIIDSLITLMGDKLPALLGEEIQLSDTYLKNIEAIEDILFGESGILSTLYTDFAKDPVLSIVSRLAPLEDIVNNVYDMGLFQEFIEPYRSLISVAATLFGDESDGFIAQWKLAYDDGSAQHHYVNAVLSLLPKIVEIYDEAIKMESISEIVEPYAQIVEFVLSFMTKDFYDAIIANGFMETILDAKMLLTIKNLVIAQLEQSEIENKDLILSLVDSFYEQFLSTLYDDLRANPAEAIATRVTVVSNLVQMIPIFQPDFDLSLYNDIINKKFFDNYLSMVPEEYQHLLPTGVTGTFTMLVRIMAFGPQYLLSEDYVSTFDTGTYFYFKPAVSGKYYICFKDIEGELSEVYFNGAGAPLSVDEEAGYSYLYTDFTANEVYELCIEDEACAQATVFVYSEDHEHVADYAVITQPDCETAGLQSGVCTICGKTVTAIIPALGHTPGEAAKENEVPATCTEAGSYNSVIRCTVCQKVLSSQPVDVPALGHTPGEAAHENEVAATCTTPGSYNSVIRCTVCQEVISSLPVEIPALGHDYGTKVVAPTATAAGYTIYTCKLGDETHKADYTAPTGKVSGFKCKARTAAAETLVWSKVKAANGYQIQISTKDGKKWDKTYNLKAGVTAYTFKSLSAGCEYKFRIRFFVNTPEGAKYTAWVNLTSPTLPAGTTITKISGAKKAFTAQWKQNKAVNGYQVQYGLKSNFSKAKMLTVKSNKTLKATLKKLSAKKVYYVRIRTYKTMSKVNYYSAWSKTYKVKTK